MSLLRELIDYDPLTKTKTVFHEMDDNTNVIETVADVTDLIESNKAKYNDVDERARFGEKSWVVASIPMHVYFDLERKGIAGDKKKFAAWLNDPENLYYRTRPGRV